MYHKHPSSFFNKGKQNTNEPKDFRIISCIDMDAFYAKAEALRNGLDENLPIVVIHGRSSISINYAARKYGITRYGPTLLTEVDEMRRLCPHVILIHVDTIKPGEPYIDPYKRDLKDKFVIRNRDDEKVNLDFYRMEAEKIRNLLGKHCRCVEKASIDESFLDLTREVNDIYDKGEYGGQEWIAKLAGGDEGFLPETKQEILLMIASQLTDQIRKEVEATLKYTCSAGISYNKMLAKVASGINKPNDQTVILERFTQAALSPLDISKLRNFGGKVAEVFKASNYKTLGDLQKLSLEELQQILGDVNSAKWVYFRCRGFDDETVGKKDTTNKSLSSNKSFAIKTTSIIELENMIDLILLDLATRTARFFKESGALPTNLNLHYWDNLKREQKTKSTQILLNDGEEESLHVTMKQKAQDLLKLPHSILFPCKTIGISVRHFVKKEAGNSNLLSFLKKNSETENHSSPTKKATGNSFVIIEDEEERDNGPINEGESEQQPMIVEAKKQEFCEKVRCEKCQILLPSDELMSHQDLHLAYDLDKELNPNKKKYRKLNESEVEVTLNQLNNISSQNSCAPIEAKNPSVDTKRKQNKSKGEPVKMKSLESFFQKK